MYYRGPREQRWIQYALQGWVCFSIDSPSQLLWDHRQSRGRVRTTKRGRFGLWFLDFLPNNYHVEEKEELLAYRYVLHKYLQRGDFFCQKVSHPLGREDQKNTPTSSLTYTLSTTRSPHHLQLASRTNTPCRFQSFTPSRERERERGKHLYMGHSNTGGTAVYYSPKLRKGHSATTT